MDLTQLAISFESKENLVEKMKSPFPTPYGTYSESFQNDFRLPACYDLSKSKQTGMREEMIREVLPERVLFYIFYNLPNDRQQIVAAETLTARGWTYIPEDMRWVRMKVI